MTILSIIIHKFKSVTRTKELYTYIIGFPLVFMIIYGSFTGFAYSKVEPIKIGFLNNDVPVKYTIGEKTYQTNFGEKFYNYLSDLKYEGTNTSVFNIVNISSREEAEQKTGKLEVAAVVEAPSNFSKNVINALKSITYLTLVGVISNEANNAYELGNYELASRYWAALTELSSFSNLTYKIKITIISDPTYSKATQTYELAWKYLINFVFREANEFTTYYANYLSQKYNITIDINSESFSSAMEQTFQVEFERIGGKGGLKESFTKMYFAVLVPGQIVQSIMLAAVSVLYMLYGELTSGLIERIKLTKVSSTEYISGIVLSWGIIALFQAIIMLAAAIILGYIKVVGSVLDYLLSVTILVMAGILTASFSIIIASLTKKEIANHIVLMVLITVSLMIAGYFPIQNPVLGNLFGREFTVMDLIPWRSAITGLRKSLMLADIYSPIDVLPDLLLLTIWTAIYTAISFIVFSAKILRKAATY